MKKYCEMDYVYVPYGHLRIGVLKKFLILNEMAEIKNRLPSVKEIVDEIGGSESNAYQYYIALFYLHFPEYVAKMVLELLEKYKIDASIV